MNDDFNFNSNAFSSNVNETNAFYKKKLKRWNKKVKLCVSIISLISLIIGVSYAFIKYSHESRENMVGTECLKLSIITEGNAITLNKAYPITDQEGQELSPYTFTVKNTCSVPIDYNINLESLKIDEIPINKLMESKYIKVAIDEQEIKTLEEYDPASHKLNEEALESHTLLNGYLDADEEEDHELRLWINSGADSGSQNKSFYSQIVIEGTTYKSIANNPVIVETKVNKLDEAIEDLSVTNQYVYDGNIKVTCTKAKENCYVKANKNVNIISGSILANCGSGENPNTCTTDNIESMNANTWYKVTNTSIIKSTVLNEETQLEALSCVPENCSEKVEGKLYKKDITEPIINITDSELSNGGAEITYEILETESGIASISCQYRDSDNSIVNGTIDMANNKCLFTGFVEGNVYSYDIIATDKVGNIGQISSTVSNIETVEAPVIIGGMVDDTYEPIKTIRISREGIADSGVSYYEYYISNTNTTPDSDVTITGITNGEISISNANPDNLDGIVIREGTSYIFFRTVSVDGNRSGWSNYQKVNIFYKASSVEYTNPAMSGVQNAQQAFDLMRGLIE